MANGKVCTGFSRPYVAIYNTNSGNVTYSNGRILARGVNVNIAPDSSDDNNFYADNQRAETGAGTFTGGTLTLTVDGLFTAAEKLIMGLPEANAEGWTAYGDQQSVPNMGVGYIARYMSDGVTTYTPTILAKVKFNQVSSEAATQEEEIDWQTQELTAAMMRGDDANHNWKYVGAEFATEDEADAAIRAMFNITDPGTHTVTQNLTNVTSDFAGQTVLDAAALTVELTPESGYTLDTVTVLMGGDDITATVYADGVVTIASVTGDVVITAVGSEGP